MRYIFGYYHPDPAGMASAESLFDSNPSWGDDPSIAVIGGVDPTVRFPAWKYAKERCREICGDAPIGQ
jgi:hypothetical protein